MEQRYPCDPSWLHPNSGLWTALYICSSLSDNFEPLLMYKNFYCKWKYISSSGVYCLLVILNAYSYKDSEHAPSRGSLTYLADI